MHTFTPPICRLVILALSLICFCTGLALKGFFTGRRYRRQRLTILFSCGVAGLIGIWMVAANQRNHSILLIQHQLLNVILLVGRTTGTWIELYQDWIKICCVSLIIVLAAIVGLTKKRQGIPFLLLIFSAGASLLGGIALGTGEITLGIYFLTGAVLYAWLCGLVSRKLKGPALPDHLKGLTGYALLALIILLGFFLRIHDLGEVSFRFDHYETDYARQALRVISGHHDINLWKSTIWRGLGHMNLSPIYTYCVALFFRLFGVSIFSLKLVAVFYGTIALLFTYGIFKTLFGRRLALLTTFLLAVSPMHINYSRIGLLLVSTQTVSLIIIYLLLRCLRGDKSYVYVLLGTTVSFTAYFYSPAKYPILISAVLMVIYILFRRRFLRNNFTKILLLILTVIAITIALNIPTWGLIAPRFAGYESVWHRTSSHLHTREADYIRAIPLIQENFTRLIHSFFIGRNFNYNPWPCGYLYFNPFVSIMVLAGIAYSLANIKKANYRILLFLTAAFLVPNLLSRPPVVVRRMMVSWPFIYCLAAIPVSQFFIKSRRLFPRAGNLIVIGLTISALLILGAYNCHVFFDSKDPAGRWEEERYFDEYAKNLPDIYHVYLLPHNQLSRKTLGFLLATDDGPGISRYEYMSPVQLRELARKGHPPRRPVAFVGATSQIQIHDLNTLRDRLGGGKIEDIKTGGGRIVGYALLSHPGDTGIKLEEDDPKTDLIP